MGLYFRTADVRGLVTDELILETVYVLIKWYVSMVSSTMTALKAIALEHIQ
jgi:phosphomannomutase